MQQSSNLAILVALAIVACGEPASSTTALHHPDAVPDRSVIAESAPSRRIAGRCETVLAPPLPLSPGVVRQIDRGSCQLSHLGRADFYSDKTIQLAAGTQSTIATFTAPNGDLLEAAGSGANVLISPGRVRFTAMLTFTGGTGRFAGSSGQASVEGEADLVNGTSTLSLDGTVAYAGSTRSSGRR